MTEMHIPLIAAYPSNFEYSAGRLHGKRNDQFQLVVMPPDGVFLQTLRIKGELISGNALSVSFYRTPKDEFFKLPSVDTIVQQDITDYTIPFITSIPLAPSGKNVVDNSTYNYTFTCQAGPVVPPLDDVVVYIGEVALFY